MPTVVEHCRRRAIATGAPCGAVALLGIVPLQHDAPTLYDGLTGRAAPAIVGVRARRRRRRAEPVAPTARRRPGAVGRGGHSVLVGWAAGQYPWMLTDALTIEEAAAGRPTLWALLVHLLPRRRHRPPALAYLFWLTQRSGWARLA